MGFEGQREFEQEPGSARTGDSDRKEQIICVGLITLVGWKVGKVNGDQNLEVDLTGQVIKRSFWVLELRGNLTFSNT